MGILGFLQRLFSGAGIVKAVKEFEEPVELFGDFVTSFFAGVEEEEREVIERRRIELPPEPELFEEEPSDEEVFVRKIVKTGKSAQGYRNLFALTFEPNEIDRFSELRQAIEEEFDMDLAISDLGYDDITTTDRPPFIWPEIRTGKE